MKHANFENGEILLTYICAILFSNLLQSLRKSYNVFFQKRLRFPRKILMEMIFMSFKESTFSDDGNFWDKETNSCREEQWPKSRERVGKNVSVECKELPQIRVAWHLYGGRQQLICLLIRGISYLLLHPVRWVLSSIFQSWCSGLLDIGRSR